MSDHERAQLEPLARAVELSRSAGKRWEHSSPEHWSQSFGVVIRPEILAEAIEAAKDQGFEQGVLTNIKPDADAIRADERRVVGGQEILRGDDS